MSEKDWALVCITIECELKSSGSDMHVLLTGDLGYSKFSKPFILGHECAGIVVKGVSSPITLLSKLRFQSARTSPASKSAIESLWKYVQQIVQANATARRKLSTMRMV